MKISHTAVLSKTLDMEGMLVSMIWIIKKLKLQSAPLINGRTVNICNPNTTDLRRCIMAQRQP